MNQTRFSKLLYILLLFVLVACQARATPTAVSPTVAPTAVPPTAPPVPALTALATVTSIPPTPSVGPNDVLISSASDLTGSWQTSQSNGQGSSFLFYLIVNEDGTFGFHQGPTLAGSIFWFGGGYQFEGTRLTVTGKNCPEAGEYYAVIRKPGETEVILDFQLIRDTCKDRLRMFQGSLWKPLNP